MLTPIPTNYRGVSFRSRHEARWALLLDVLCVDWQYEVEGFQLSTGWYLPDFWLPEFHCFAEVKAVTEQWTDAALTKAERLAHESGHCVLLLGEITVLDQHVRVYLPCGDFYWADLPKSKLYGRVWFEFESDCKILYLRQCKDLDYGWALAAEQAIQQRFEYRPNAR